MFMPSAASEADEEKLDQLLKSWNQVRVAVPRDGNCLFYSVAHNLKIQMNKGNTNLQQILNNINIREETSLLEIITSLRKGVVKQWLGQNSKYYQKFMTDGQLHIQAEEFLQDGVYSSDIGDLVITALSNMLQTPLVLFTSHPTQPLYIQHPTYCPTANTNPIYLAYLHAGPGHYDAVIPIEDREEVVAHLEIPIHCNCGRKNSKGNACSYSLAQYTCRCPCYNSQQSCGQHCKCKGCTNTYGVKPMVEASKTVIGQKRKRSSHASQSVLLRGKWASTFMEDIGEPISAGGFSKMEYLVICSIVQSLIADNWDWDQSRDVDAGEVVTLYGYILELVKILHVQIALFEREKDKIVKLLRSTSHKWDFFRQKNGY